MNNDWSAGEVEKLLCSLASDPNASAGGGDDCKVHKGGTMEVEEGSRLTDRHQDGMRNLNFMGTIG